MLRIKDSLIRKGEAAASHRPEGFAWSPAKRRGVGAPSFVPTQPGKQPGSASLRPVKDPERSGETPRDSGRGSSPEGKDRRRRMCRSKRGELAPLSTSAASRAGAFPHHCHLRSQNLSETGETYSPKYMGARDGQNITPNYFFPSIVMAHRFNSEKDLRRAKLVPSETRCGHSTPGRAARLRRNLRKAGDAKPEAGRRSVPRWPTTALPRPESRRSRDRPRAMARSPRSPRHCPAHSCCETSRRSERVPTRNEFSGRLRRGFSHTRRG